MKRVGSTTLGWDAAALAVAGLLISFGWPFLRRPPSPEALAVLGLATLVVGWELRLYTTHLNLRPVNAVAPILGATALASLIAFLSPLPRMDRLTTQQLAQAWLLATGALVFTHVALARLGVGRAVNTRSTLIVGAGRVGRMIEQRLRRDPTLGLDPVGFLDDAPLLGGDGHSEAPVLGGIADLRRVVRAHDIRHVLIAFSKASDDELLGVVRRCEALGVTVAVVPRLFELAVDRRDVPHLGGIPLVGVRRSTPTHLQETLKNLVDRVAAAILLILLSPILVLTSAAVLISLGRPVFFRQLRVGKDGRSFEMLKLRTMTGDELRRGGSEETYRCTGVGAFLRRTSLDELPQLVNILEGQMSFIGPRPERPELVADFRERIYRYDDRHRVKGGISGWAQVHGIGRGEDRFGDEVLVDRAEWDNYYIEHWSAWLELKILCKTVSAVWRFRQRASGAAVVTPSEAPIREPVVPGTEPVVREAIVRSIPRDLP